MSSASSLETERINQDLEELYREKLTPILHRLIGLVEPSRPISHPLLGQIAADYLRSMTRLIIVGQQTQSWAEDLKPEHTVDGIIKRSFEEYHRALTTHGKPFTTSPFWRAARYVYSKSNVDMDSMAQGFFWTNLWKVDQAIDCKGEPSSGEFKRGLPNKELQELLLKNFCVLRDEIRILKPHVVVFFTGPKYDQDLQKIMQCEMPPSIPASPAPSVSCIPSTPGLPILMRTYHPSFLNRQKRERWLSTLDEIVKLAKERASATPPFGVK